MDPLGRCRELCVRYVPFILTMSNFIDSSSRDENGAMYYTKLSWLNLQSSELEAMKPELHRFEGTPQI